MGLNQLPGKTELLLPCLTRQGRLTSSQVDTDQPAVSRRTAVHRPLQDHLRYAEGASSPGSQHQTRWFWRVSRAPTPTIRLQPGLLPRASLTWRLAAISTKRMPGGTSSTETEAKINGEAPTTNGVKDGAASTEELTQTPIVKVNCHECGIDCTRIYYHSSQADANSKAKYDLCASCYAEGRMPSNQSNSHYTRMENPTYSTVLDRDAPWSDAEVPPAA